MKMLPSNQDNPGSQSDYSDVMEFQKRLAEASRALNDMAQEVGMSKHIQEYDSDRRKQALARAMTAPLAGGESAAKAEATARADKVYAQELSVLAKQHQAACETETAWAAQKIAWETARSLLSMQKETVRHI